MAGQRIFCSVKSRFLTGQKIEKSELILLSSMIKCDCIFTKRKKNLRFTGKDLTVCSRMRVCLAGQHDRRMTLLAGQDTLMAGRCLLSGRYIEPWKCTILHGNV